MRAQTSFIFLAGILAGGVAAAQGNFDFDRADTDGDGYLTQAEWNAAGDRRVEFDAIDTNRDGRLTEAEVKAGFSEARGEQASLQTTAAGQSPLATQAAAQEQPPVTPVSAPESQQRNVALYDTNEDGRVSRDEAQKDGELVTWFVVWDTDQDGYLNQSEIERGNRETQQQSNGARGEIERQQGAGDLTREGDRQPQDMGQPIDQAGALGTPSSRGAGDAAASFEQADANRDNRVSRSEASAAGVQVLIVSFDDLDANRDGYLDRNEAAGRARNGSGGGGGAPDVSRFEAYDANDDGYLGVDEVGEDAYLDTHFEAWDANGDDRLDKNEIGRDWAEWNEDSFDTYDVNGDGLLEEREATEYEYLNSSFNAWDTDRDGFVSEEEAREGARGDEQPIERTPTELR